MGSSGSLQWRARIGIQAGSVGVGDQRLGVEQFRGGEASSFGVGLAGLGLMFMVLAAIPTLLFLIGHIAYIYAGVKRVPPFAD